MRGVWKGNEGSFPRRDRRFVRSVDVLFFFSAQAVGGKCPEGGEVSEAQWRERGNNGFKNSS